MRPRIFMFGLVLGVASVSPPEILSTSAGTPSSPADHPKLLFSVAELPTLRKKVRNGGPDDDAYAFIRSLTTTTYPGESFEDMQAYTFGMDVTLHIGLATYLEDPIDTDAAALGRRITLDVVRDYDPDDNVFFSPVRLRLLTFGYDMFFGESGSQRDSVRAEIETYMDSIQTAFNYKRWLHRPYVSNISAMIGASLGLAAIRLHGEIPDADVEAALDLADTYVDVWMKHLLDPDGSYKEGAMYCGWSFHHLAYYFHARKRFDGLDYAKNPRIRNIESWLAFATLPNNLINNINDAASLNRPLARHFTYLDWAKHEYSSGVAAWLWERHAGSMGFDAGRLADKAATVLWHRPLQQENPGATLPRHFLWEDRGLYYFRTGWSDEEISNHVVFSFFSGKFHGGHWQEDQNNFTIFGYGNPLVVDNGFARVAVDSRAHNMIFIDGRGQHYAGTTLGTDGRIAESLIGSYADYLLGDATAAYSTYSEFNAPDVPFPGEDWSWGYKGANPVEFAERRFLVVHDTSAPPYFVLIDDIKKDTAEHAYAWRMHSAGAVDPTTNPVVIDNSGSRMLLHVIQPEFSQLVKTVTPFDNQNEDIDTQVLSLEQTSVSARFVFLMIPANDQSPIPTVTTDRFSWGSATRLAWSLGIEDVLIVNDSGGSIEYVHAGSKIETDAYAFHARFVNGELSGYLATNVTTVTLGNTNNLQIDDGPATVSLSDASIEIDREDAEFTIFAPRGQRVFYRGEEIPTVRNGAFVVPSPTGAGAAPPGHPVILSMQAYPNPFNPSVRVFIDVGLGIPVQISVFDVAGRRVRSLWEGPLTDPAKTVEWDGADDRGVRVATGVYFVRASTSVGARSVKVHLIK